LFDEGERPAEVTKLLEMKDSTAKRYFQQWKKLGPNFERKYAYTKSLFEQSAPDRERNLELFARACGITKEELEAILVKPHGLRQLMTGKLYFPGHAETDAKLNISLELALLISDHMIKGRGKIEDVLFAFEYLMKERMQYRTEVEADIKEENEEIAFKRKVLETAVEVEKEGRVKRDRLTEEEREAAIRYGLEAKVKSKLRDLETQYWFRIGELMAEGLSKEQAREKIYQDLIDNGDLKGAEEMRKYQDNVHPLNANEQKPPWSGSQ